MWLWMAALWIMNGFDLTLTLHAHEQGLLTEENPLAQAALTLGPTAVSTFKIGLVGFGSLILLVHRRRRLVEYLAWVAVVAYLAVSIRWLLCSAHYLDIVAYRYLEPIGVG